MIEIDGIAGFAELVGTHLGYTEFEVIDQARVNQFADATDDHQWIHVDVERAASSNFGGTVVHGYLVLSMLPHFFAGLWKVRGFRHGVNYGSDRVRYPNTVIVGSRIRCGATIDKVEPVGGGHQVTITGTVEVEGQDKPALVASVMYRYF